jgi:hypothetical protein
MIETPVKAPPPTGPPAAPPPDVRTRVMDPPPDPGARHLHACEECGTPLHPEQAACLSCGTMVDRDSGVIGAGIRRAALGSATALLVLGCAVGAAGAGLPHGKHVGRGPIAKVVGPKALPPATGGSNTATGSGNSPLADSGTGTKPPALAPTAPKSDNAPKFPKAPSSPSGGGGGGGGGGTPAGGSGGAPASNGNDNGSSDDGNSKPEPKHHSPKPPKPTGPTLYATGEAPYSSSIFTLSGSTPGAGATIDGDAKTAYSTAKNDRGVAVERSPGQYKAIGVITETPGWSLEIYYTKKANPGGVSSGDWTQVAATNAERQNKFDVPKDAKRLLVWIADAGGETVRINEIQLFE